MPSMDKVSMDHYRGYLEMVRSGEWARLQRADRKRREALDRKQGHSPKCGIEKCHPECTAKAKDGGTNDRQA